MLHWVGMCGAGHYSLTCYSRNFHPLVLSSGVVLLPQFLKLAFHAIIQGSYLTLSWHISVLSCGSKWETGAMAPEAAQANIRLINAWALHVVAGVSIQPLLSQGSPSQGTRGSIRLLLLLHVPRGYSKAMLVQNTLKITWPFFYLFISFFFSS